MKSLEEAGINKRENLAVILEKAKKRRSEFLMKAGNSDNEIVEAIYHLSAEMCELEKLVTILAPLFT